MVYRGKDLNEGLKKKQEEQRQMTIATIEEAIKSFQDEKYLDITIKMLIDATGFTRPTFSKPHVQGLLKKYKIGKYKFLVKLPKSSEDKLTFLEKKVQEYMAMNERLKNEVNEKDTRNKTLNEKLRKANLEIEYLNQELYEKLKDRG